MVTTLSYGAPGNVTVTAEGARRYKAATGRTFKSKPGVTVQGETTTTQLVQTVNANKFFVPILGKTFTSQQAAINALKSRGLSTADGSVVGVDRSLKAGEGRITSGEAQRIQEIRAGEIRHQVNAYNARFDTPTTVSPTIESPTNIDTGITLVDSQPTIRERVNTFLQGPGGKNKGIALQIPKFTSDKGFIADAESGTGKALELVHDVFPSGFAKIVDPAYQKYIYKPASKQFDKLKVEVAKEDSKLGNVIRGIVKFDTGVSTTIRKVPLLGDLFVDTVEGIRTSAVSFAETGVKNLPATSASLFSTISKFKSLSTLRSLGIGGVGLPSIVSTPLQLTAAVEQARIISPTTVKSFEGAGFSTEQAKLIDLGSRSIFAESLGNEFGGITKFVGGFFEGTLQADALLDYSGPIDTNFFGLTGEDKVRIGERGKLFGTTTKTIPGIDTLNDPRFKTVTKFFKDEKQAKSFIDDLSKKEFARSDITPAKFENIILKGPDFESDPIGFKFDAETTKTFEVGRLPTILSFGVIGGISAEVFNMIIEKPLTTLPKTKTGKAVGKVVATTAGFTLDLGEGPGDFGDEIGLTTPFGKAKGGPSTTFTSSILKSIEGDIGKINVKGGTLTQSKFKFTGSDVKGKPFNAEININKIKVNPSIAASVNNNFGFSTGEGKKVDIGSFDLTKNTDLIKNVGLIKSTDFTKGTSRTNVLNITPSLSTSLTNTNLPTINTGALTNVNINNITNIRDIGDVININKSTTNTQTQTTSFTNTFTFTPGFFPPLPPLGGGGSGRRRLKGVTRRARAKYLPSLAAIGLGIKGKRPGFLSGLGIRPIQGMPKFKVPGLSTPRKRKAAKRKKKKR